MYVYDIVRIVSNMFDKQILLKMVIYWLKHIKDNKLKYQHLSITLDYVLKNLTYNY
jgi:hypothetical protein